MKERKYRFLSTVTLDHDIALSIRHLINRERYYKGIILFSSIGNHPRWCYFYILAHISASRIHSSLIRLHVPSRDFKSFSPRQDFLPTWREESSSMSSIRFGAAFAIVVFVYCNAFPRSSSRKRIGEQKTPEWARFEAPTREKNESFCDSLGRPSVEFESHREVVGRGKPVMSVGGMGGLHRGIRTDASASRFHRGSAQSSCQ